MLNYKSVFTEPEVACELLDSGLAACAVSSEIGGHGAAGLLPPPGTRG